MKTKEVQVHEVTVRFEVPAEEVPKMRGQWPFHFGDFTRALNKGHGHVLAALVQGHLVDAFPSLYHEEFEVSVDGEDVAPGGAS